MGRLDRFGVYCPPMVYLTGSDDAGLLLAWIRHAVDGSWTALIVWIRRTSDGHERKFVEVSGAAIRPLEAPAAYREVPRLLLDVDGTVRPWERDDRP
jgi:hypothetical protein